MLTGFFPAAQADISGCCGQGASGNAIPKNLDRLVEAQKKKGDLDNLLILQEERKRFSAEMTVPPPASARDAFRPASEAYYQAMVTLLGRYVKGLDTLTRTDVSADRIEEAMVTRKEKENARREPRAPGEPEMASLAPA